MSKKKNVVNIIITVTFIIMTMIFSLSSAILVPAMFRPFYYMQINPLHIPEYSGFSYSQIKTAFDDVLNFIWLGTPFKTGDLKFSEEGMMHFKDCVPLFWLDLILCIISFVSLITIYLLQKFKVIKLKKFFNFHPLFYAGVLLFTFIIILGIWAAIDFNSLFTAFHKVFFPGKENWLFDPDEDQVILILPINFFMNCALYIGIVVITYNVFGIAYSIINRVGLVNKIIEKKNKKKVVINSIYHLDDVVMFSYRGDMTTGYIYEISLDENGDVLYSIQIGGECPAVIPKIKEKDVRPNIKRY